MADPRPEVLPLSLEEVRRWSEAAQDPRPFVMTHAMLRSLCATVEHWHREAAAERDEAELKGAALRGQGAKGAELAEERARLSALVARMRDTIEVQSVAIDELALDAGVDAYDDWLIVAQIDRLAEEVLADPDGQLASEELRLLREWERTCATPATSEAMSEQASAWLALRAFRERQGGPS